ncbi:hypothetical protein SDC9_94426 [bioreactor metagenome]|uniref:Uncharacterized protein n=1 Tax=bioreactor metagenome TaxID=1076179 RepID=A0A645A3T8_9ZZZZ
MGVVHLLALMNDSVDFDAAVVFEDKGVVCIFERNLCLNQSAFQRLISCLVGDYPSEVGQAWLFFISGRQLFSCPHIRADVVMVVSCGEKLRLSEEVGLQGNAEHIFVKLLGFDQIMDGQMDMAHDGAGRDAVINFDHRTDYAVRIHRFGNAFDFAIRTDIPSGHLFVAVDFDAIAFWIV